MVELKERGVRKENNLAKGVPALIKVGTAGTPIIGLGAEGAALHPMHLRNSYTRQVQLVHPGLNDCGECIAGRCLCSATVPSLLEWTQLESALVVNTQGGLK